MEEADDFVPISALQHVVFCERQAALIHVERLWAENRLTALGRVVHERTDTPGRDRRRGVRVERAVALHSERLRLRGVADVVEWRDGTPRPVETKRGPVVDRLADRVQVCAQALCLEEMFGVTISTAVLFYAQSHRRVEIALDAELRAHTARAAARVHALIRSGELPAPELGPKCRQCSLETLCQPKVMRKAVAPYLAALFTGQ
jgi:CRISPR-associated exonuclease Cas4